MAASGPKLLTVRQDMSSSMEVLRTLRGWNKKVSLYGQFRLAGESAFSTSDAVVYELSGDILTLYAVGRTRHFDLKGATLDMGENLPHELRKRFTKVVGILLEDGGRILLAEPVKM